MEIRILKYQNSFIIYSDKMKYKFIIKKQKVLVFPLKKILSIYIVVLYKKR